MVRRVMLLVLVVLGAASAGSLDRSEAGGTTTSMGVEQASVALRGAHTFRLAGGTTHIAFYWRSRSGARVRYALSRDGRNFGRVRPVRADETAKGRRGETYGALIIAAGAHAVRVESNRP